MREPPVPLSTIAEPHVSPGTVPTSLVDGLQSSSMLLPQISTLSRVMSLQTRPPLTQLTMPSIHRSASGPSHDAPPPGLPLSTAPLQSSSMLLQVSVPGVTEPPHEPHIDPTPPGPATHVC